MLSNDQINISLYRCMYTIRETEKLLLDGFSKGIFSGTVHTCVGQEAVSAGIMEAFRGAAAVFSNHRGHGHMISSGLSPEKLIYEVASIDEGQCAGLGGSQHIAAPDIGFMGSNGITGGSVPIAVGHAFGKRLLGGSVPSVVFFGDGATSQGVVHEAMNMASIWKLPVLFVCENNCYAMSSPKDKFVSYDLTSRAAGGYGMVSTKVDGMDAEKIYKHAINCRDNFLAEGPVFMECLTYRYSGHSKSDRQLYRSRKEVKEWKERDPIKKICAKIDPIKVESIKNGVDSDLSVLRDKLGI